MSKLVLDRLLVDFSTYKMRLGSGTVLTLSILLETGAWTGGWGGRWAKGEGTSCSYDGSYGWERGEQYQILFAAFYYLFYRAERRELSPFQPLSLTDYRETYLIHQIEKIQIQFSHRNAHAALKESRTSGEEESERIYLIKSE